MQEQQNTPPMGEEPPRVSAWRATTWENFSR